MCVLLPPSPRQGTFPSCFHQSDQVTSVAAQVLKPEEYFITEQPYYEAIGNEIEACGSDGEAFLEYLLAGR